MAVCLTGMHRSGTSMVMSLLARAGLHVGDERDLMPANASNLEGHWEHLAIVDLNDAVLSAMGGSWDHPPAGPVPIPYPSASIWTMLRAEAVRLHRDISAGAGAAPWGWKDPRASLTAPFWLDAEPDLQFIACLRHPLDVAASLHSRAYMSYELGLSLWEAYNERLLASIPSDRRLVTHYDAFFARPVDELRRLCRFAGLETDDGLLRDACAGIKPQRRHHTADSTPTADVPVPPRMLRLYRQLCDEAAWPLTTAASAPRVTSVPVTRDEIVDAMQQLRQLLQAVDRVARSTATLERRSDYERLVRHVTHAIERATPPGALVAVVSKGDPDLIRLRDRTGMHFPQQPSGALAQHPRDGAEAVRQICDVAGLGAQFLAIPFWSFWWLETYPEFNEYVNAGTVSRDDICVICSVPEAATHAASRRSGTLATERRH